jgi:hypothetical protein
MDNHLNSYDKLVAPKNISLYLQVFPQVPVLDDTSTRGLNHDYQIVQIVYMIRPQSYVDMRHST